LDVPAVHLKTLQLGPKARAVLVEFLRGRSLAPDELLFSPNRQREERFVELRAHRRSKVQPSQESRRKAKPRKRPGDRYVPTAIGRAVALACKKAGVPHWFPYQLCQRRIQTGPFSRGGPGQGARD